MPHAALWVVQPESLTGSMQSVKGFNAARGFVGGATRKSRFNKSGDACFNAARGFVGGATASLAALVPLGGGKPFWKVSENLSVLTENM